MPWLAVGEKDLAQFMKGQKIEVLRVKPYIVNEVLTCFFNFLVLLVDSLFKGDGGKLKKMLGEIITCDQLFNGL